MDQYAGCESGLVVFVIGSKYTDPTTLQIFGFAHGALRWVCDLHARKRFRPQQMRKCLWACGGGGGAWVDGGWKLAALTLMNWWSLAAWGLWSGWFPEARPPGTSRLRSCRPCRSWTLGRARKHSGSTRSTPEIIMQNCKMQPFFWSKCASFTKSSF